MSYNIVIDTGTFIFLLCFFLVASVVTVVAVGSLLNHSGFFARKKVQNWVESEKVKAANIDSLKITGNTYRN